MEITNELLAAYAEGNVTPEERKQVRLYLAEHPSQLEGVMLMMDSDYGLEAGGRRAEVNFARRPSLSLRSSAYVESQAAAVASMVTFDERLDRLLDEIL